MSVLTITLVTTTNVKATTYTADDSVIISSQMHDFFNNYFNGTKSFLYFPFSCSYNDYNRTCYYGIDSENNYVKITYNGSGYNYNQVIETGVDENFQVNGNNVIRKNINPFYIIIYALIFFSLIKFVLLLLGDLLW